MRRRRDRGELSGTDVIFIVVVLVVNLVWMTGFAFIMEGYHRETHADLRRIADAVCVYAPPAEPVAPEPKPTRREVHTFPEHGTANAFGLRADGSGSVLYIVGGAEKEQCRVFVQLHDTTYWLDLDESSVPVLAAMLRRGGLDVQENKPARAVLSADAVAVTTGDSVALPGEPAMTTDDILNKVFEERGQPAEEVPNELAP